MSCLTVVYRYVRSSVITFQPGCLTEFSTNKQNSSDCRQFALAWLLRGKGILVVVHEFFCASVCVPLFVQTHVASHLRHVCCGRAVLSCVVCVFQIPMSFMRARRSLDGLKCLRHRVCLDRRPTNNDCTGSSLRFFWWAGD